MPFVNSTGYLFKIANICMLKNSETPDICEGLVADHMNFMFKLAV